MSLAPELAAFIGRPPAARHPDAKAIHGRAGLAHHGATSRSVTEPPEAKENPMPTGVYLRKKKPAVVKICAAETARAKKPAAMVKPKAPAKARATGPRFGVFEDGTVELRLASCAGIIAPTEAREFLAFLKRIGVE